MYSNTQSKNNNTTHVYQMKKSTKSQNENLSSLDELRKSLSAQIKEIENKIKELDQDIGDFRAAS